jgi:hypothetical protein
MDRKFRYWGVTCYCGEFQALKEITSFAHEKRPDDQPVKLPKITVLQELGVKRMKARCPAVTIPKARAQFSHMSELCPTCEKEGDPTGRWRLPAKCDRMG